MQCHVHWLRVASLATDIEITSNVVELYQGLVRPSHAVSKRGALEDALLKETCNEKITAVRVLS
jgi:hypothetical protein